MANLWTGSSTILHRRKYNELRPLSISADLLAEKHVGFLFDPLLVVWHVSPLTRLEDQNVDVAETIDESEKLADVVRDRGDRSPAQMLLENAADALHALVDAFEIRVDARLGLPRLHEQNRVRHLQILSNERLRTF